MMKLAVWNRDCGIDVEAERLKDAVLSSFIHRKTLTENKAAEILVSHKIAASRHDAVVRLKCVADKGGVLCNAAGYLAVERENGEYRFHYRVPSDKEREGRNSYK